MNARMSEFHAAVGLRSLDGLDARLARRNELGGQVSSRARRGRRRLVRRGSDGDRSTYKDFSILVEADEFGVDAARLATMLAVRASRPSATTRRRCTSSVRTCTSACPPTACR